MTIAEIEKKLGIKSLTLEDETIISTGSLTLNKATGVNGTVLGKVIEIFGAESSGKSTITLHQIAEYQKAIPNKKVVLLDYEHSFSPDYAERLGVDINKLLIYQLTSQEEGYDLAIKLVESEHVSLIVIDSQTAATPMKILEGDMSDATIGMQARNNSKFLAKIKGLLAKHDCSLIAISQTRVSIGSYGDPNLPTGGVSWRFYSDMRWKVSRKVDKEKELNETTVEIIKNKLGNPFTKATFAINFGEGIDYIGELIDIAVDKGLIVKGGSWFSYKDFKIQGKENFKQLIKDNDELKIELENQINA